MYTNSSSSSHFQFFQLPFLSLVYHLPAINIQLMEDGGVDTTVIKSRQHNLGWMGRNFDDYPGFQPKITPPKHFSRQCSTLIWSHRYLIVWPLLQTNKQNKDPSEMIAPLCVNTSSFVEVLLSNVSGCLSSKDLFIVVWCTMMMVCASAAKWNKFRARSLCRLIVFLVPWPNVSLELQLLGTLLHFYITVELK